MKRGGCRYRPWGALACCFWLLLAAGAAQAGAGRRVFILHSYESGHVCGQPQHDGVVAALRDAGFREGASLRIGTYYMDTKRTHNTEAAIAAQGETALAAIAAFRPEVVVTLDDNAFRTAGLALVAENGAEKAENMAPGPAVVFCGMNAQPEDYNAQIPFMKDRTRPGGCVTGVYEMLHIADAVRVHSRLFPHSSRLLVLVDGSPTGRAIHRQIRLEMAGAALPWTWEIRVVDGWKEYREQILSANADPAIGAIYPAALLLREEGGAARAAPEIFAWTTRHSRKPEIALNYAFTRMGLFGGAAVDFHSMGRQAGRMVARILNGTPAGDIPIEDARRYALVFNLERARQLGVTIPHDILLAADEVITATTAAESPAP